MRPKQNYMIEFEIYCYMDNHIMIRYYQTRMFHSKRVNGKTITIGTVLYPYISATWHFKLKQQLKNTYGFSVGDDYFVYFS